MSITTDPTTIQKLTAAEHADLDRQFGSIEQQVHRNRVIRLLRDAGADDVADRMERCGQPDCHIRYGRRLRFDCRISFCPTCRYDRIARRKRSYLPLFSEVPIENISCITLLFDAHDHLDRFAVERHGRDAVLMRRAPAAKVMLDGHRAAYGQFLRGLRDSGAIDGYLQAGAIEFELHDFADMTSKSNSHRLAFIDACRGSRSGGDHPAAAVAQDIWVSHAHFLFAARRGDKFLDRDEVRELFAAQYSKPYQVRVAKPERNDRDGVVMDDHAALAGWLQYAMKAFIDYRPKRVIELALFDAIVSKRFYCFNRCTADFKRQGLAELEAEAGESADPMQEMGGLLAPMVNPVNGTPMHANDPRASSDPVRR